MDRRYVLGSVAVFATACATQLPHTAALYARYWLQDPGPLRPVSLLSYERTVAAWQLPPQNPWAPYAKFTLLTALATMPPGQNLQSLPGGPGVAPAPSTPATPPASVISAPSSAGTLPPPPGVPVPPSGTSGAAAPGEPAGAQRQEGASVPATPSAPAGDSAPASASDPTTPGAPTGAQALGAAGSPAGSPTNGAPSAQTELPDVSKLLTVNNAIAAAAQVVATGLPEDAMWVVDLRGPAAVAFGSYLSHHAQPAVSVVPTFNNWPADNELVPAEETLAAMATMLPQQPPPEAQGSRPVFLLDAWRLAFRSEKIEEDVVDNRYYLNPGELPDPQRLRDQGIRRVIYVVELRADVETEEDDLNTVFYAYQQAGITVHFVDLEQLAGRSPEVPWATVLQESTFVIAPRPTIIYDSAFYLRARGGFGGLSARPHHFFGHYGVHRSVWHFGHGWHGAHGSSHFGHGGSHFGHGGSHFGHGGG